MGILLYYYVFSEQTKKNHRVDPLKYMICSPNLHSLNFQNRISFHVYLVMTSQYSYSKKNR